MTVRTNVHDEISAGIAERRPPPRRKLLGAASPRQTRAPHTAAPRHMDLLGDPAPASAADFGADPFVAAPVEDSADLLMGGGGEDSAPPAYDVADSLMGGAPAPETGAAAALDGFGFEADAAPAEAAEVAAAPAPAAMVFEEAASPKLQRFLDEQAANREKRREAAVKVKAELTAQATKDLDSIKAERAARIEAKKKANLAADQAAKEFFATESNPWAKIVEYCEMKPKATAKDQPKPRDTARLRGMLLDLKHNPKV